MSTKAIMKTLLLGLTALLTISGLAAATEVWDGASLTFTKLDYADWNDPTNQDALTPGVILTRQSYDCLYNTVVEAAADCWGNGGATGTEWAVGDIVDYASLNYTSFLDYGGGDIGGWGMDNNLTQPSVLHLIAEDIYIPIIFISWSCCDAGGFSYTRGTAPVSPVEGGNWSTVKALF